VTVKQYTITLPAAGRGLHEITRDIDPYCRDFKTGIAHLFLRHTSASLCITENADATVLSDTERFLSDLIPETYPKFRHTYEGSDDMPAHLKNLLLGPSLTIPLQDGRLALGTWQGVFLYEHRNLPHRRNLILTLQGA